MNWFKKLAELPVGVKLTITLIIFLIGLKFGAIVLIFLPFVFYTWKKK